ncbi:CapA family protein [Amycolatopsis nivea]|uniref:CapA family protein n=1 Tax=Amycolatopsis nivea TaxID=1644109 RepID=UPI00106FE460|nr:CapA family protein [Amycolatopsis nivea]
MTIPLSRVRGDQRNVGEHGVIGPQPRRVRSVAPDTRAPGQLDQSDLPANDQTLLPHYGNSTESRETRESCAAELAEFGFALVSLATNHTLDFGAKACAT